MYWGFYRHKLSSLFYFILLQSTTQSQSLFLINILQKMTNYQHLRTQQTLPTYHKYLLQNTPVQSRIRTYPHSYQLSNPITPLSNSSSTKSITKSNAYYIYDEGYDRQNLKKILYQDYEAQLKNKRDRNTLQQIQQRQLQKKLLQKTQQIQARIQWHDYQKKLNKQRQLSEDYHHKQQLKKYTKLLEQEQKGKQRLFLQNKKPINKRAIFEEFYMNCDKGMKMNSRMYLDKVAPIQQKREVQKDKLTQAGINRIAHKYSHMHENIQSQNNQKILELRNELKHQRQHKQQMRKYNSQQKLKPFNQNISIDYHDPIINPVNLGVNPENKYLVAEIRKNVERMGPTNSREVMKSAELKLNSEGTISRKGLSQLARNGSKVLL